MHPRLLPALVVALLVAYTPCLSSQQPQRLPSEVLHDILQGRLENLRLTPDEVEARFKPLLADVRTTGLAPDEEVALGLSYFFTFDGLSALPLLERHAARTDVLGRVSMQSLQQMSFFGAKDYALVERRLAEYRARFRPDSADLQYTSGMVRNLASLAAANGDHARAVSLVLEDVRTLPPDLPLLGFENLARMFESFRTLGRADTAVALMRRHRDALQSALRPADDGDSAPDTSIVRPTRAMHRQGVMHYMPFADGMMADEPGYTRAALVRRVAARQVARFTRWIEAAERGEPLSF